MMQEEDGQQHKLHWGSTAMRQMPTTPGRFQGQQLAGVGPSMSVCGAVDHCRKSDHRRHFSGTLNHQIVALPVSTFCITASCWYGEVLNFR